MSNFPGCQPVEFLMCTPRPPVSHTQVFGSRHKPLLLSSFILFFSFFSALLTHWPMSALPRSKAPMSEKYSCKVGETLPCMKISTAKMCHIKIHDAVVRSDRSCQKPQLHGVLGFSPDQRHPPRHGLCDWCATCLPDLHAMAGPPQPVPRLRRRQVARLAPPRCAAPGQCRQLARRHGAPP